MPNIATFFFRSLCLSRRFRYRYCIMNKNFPAGLSISHSSYPSSFRSTLDPLDAHVEELSSVLSAEAQDKAIAKFGIAGRVWYNPRSPSFRDRVPPTGNDAAGKQPTQ